MPKNRFLQIVVEPREVGQRLDVYLAGKMVEEHSRAHLQKMIKNGAILVNGQSVSQHYPVKEGDKIHE